MMMMMMIMMMMMMIYCSGPAICHRASVMAECQRGVRNPLIWIDLWLAALIQIDLWIETVNQIDLWLRGLLG